VHARVFSLWDLVEKEEEEEEEKRR